MWGLWEVPTILVRRRGRKGEEGRGGKSTSPAPRNDYFYMNIIYAE